MRWIRRFAQVRHWIALIVLGSSTIGCGASPQKPSAAPSAQAPTTEPPRRVTPIPERQFADSVRRILREQPESELRLAILGATIERQFRHAADYFRNNQPERGARAVMGALYLRRIGDRKASLMASPAADAALHGATIVYSARGDEGRAKALMDMRLAGMRASDPRRAQIQIHLDALKRWQRETRTGGDMQRLASEQRAAFNLALLDPTQQSITAAMEATARWVDRAVAYNIAYQQNQVLPPRREAPEAFRALRTGATTMAALFLRNGDARNAVVGVERTSAGRIVNPDFFSLLRAAARDDTAEDWRQLVRYFITQAQTVDAPNIDEIVLDSALWGMAVEAYRRDPSSLVTSHVLARQLTQLELTEAAPLILNDALGREPTLMSLSSATGFIANVLSDASDDGTSALARRVYAASEPIIERASQRFYRGRVDPSPAKLNLLMADIELRDGKATTARDLLLRVVESEPSVWRYTRLAKLERQMGNDDVSLRYARNATGLKSASFFPFDVANAELLQVDLLRQSGKSKEAENILVGLLKRLDALKTGKLTPMGRIRRNRIMAKTLDRLGGHDQAQQAFEQAMDIANEHREALPMTALDFIAWCFAKQNLTAARSTLHRIQSASLRKDTLLYAAVWVMLMEEQQGKRPSSAVERVLLDAKSNKDWTGTLARWARGNITDDALLQSASNHGERVEAKFYGAVRRLHRGDPSAQPILNEVSRDPLFDILEVGIARAMVEPRKPTKASNTP